MEWIICTQSPEETKELGKHLGKMLNGGDVICLKGDLGAGKTAFAKGLGLGLGVEESMTSPTFTLMQEYEVKHEGQSLCLVHMDLYRLRQPEEAEVIGVEDRFQPETVCIIEWPEMAESLLPDDCLEVTIEGSGESVRTLRFVASSEDWGKRLGPVFRA